MKQYSKAEFNSLPQEDKDVLTLSTPLGSQDDPDDIDDTGYAGLNKQDS